MKVYLDLCCLKRPFDDPTVLRNRLEAEAVVAIQKAIEGGVHGFVRSAAHEFENAQNPDPVRRARVDDWLGRHLLPEIDPDIVEPRALELSIGGGGAADAKHLAWAEALGAEVFVTTDDRLIARAARQPSIVRLRVVGPVEFLQEVKM